MLYIILSISIQFTKHNKFFRGLQMMHCFSEPKVVELLLFCGGPCPIYLTSFWRAHSLSLSLLTAWWTSWGCGPNETDYWVAQKDTNQKLSWSLTNKGCCRWDKDTEMQEKTWARLRESSKGVTEPSPHIFLHICNMIIGLCDNHSLR